MLCVTSLVLETMLDEVKNDSLPQFDTDFSSLLGLRNTCIYLSRPFGSYFGWLLAR